ncbi:MAG: DarT ssDNA thymidine ADP-ribosyltransferase family protein [Desulfosalsimonas sp.]|uniref:DarT ssDNA thymidine ADP-ribosyltransferase family protein n=1 Tax=Desulfosalsimonas sp. TaxID=3073848 RepID=UPI003970591F
MLEIPRKMPPIFQEPLIYAVSTVEEIIQAGLDFVFSDGHGIAAYTEWFDDINDLEKIDWDMVYATYWADTVEDMDRMSAGRRHARAHVHL